MTEKVNGKLEFFDLPDTSHITLLMSPSYRSIQLTKIIRVEVIREHRRGVFMRCCQMPRLADDVGLGEEEMLWPMDVREVSASRD